MKKSLRLQTALSLIVLATFLQACGGNSQIGKPKSSQAQAAAVPIDDVLGEDGEEPKEVPEVPEVPKTPIKPIIPPANLLPVIPKNPVIPKLPIVTPYPILPNLPKPIVTPAPIKFPNIPPQLLIPVPPKKPPVPPVVLIPVKPILIPVPPKFLSASSVAFKLETQKTCRLTYFAPDSNYTESGSEEFTTTAKSCRAAVLADEGLIYAASNQLCSGAPTLDELDRAQHGFMVETISGSAHEGETEYFSLANCSSR